MSVEGLRTGMKTHNYGHDQARKLSKLRGSKAECITAAGVAAVPALHLVVDVLL